MFRRLLLLPCPGVRGRYLVLLLWSTLFSGVKIVLLYLLVFELLLFFYEEQTRYRTNNFIDIFEESLFVLFGFYPQRYVTELRYFFLKRHFCDSFTALGVCKKVAITGTFLLRTFFCHFFDWLDLVQKIENFCFFFNVTFTCDKAVVLCKCV